MKCNSQTACRACTAAAPAAPPPSGASTETRLRHTTFVRSSIPPLRRVVEGCLQPPSRHSWPHALHVMKTVMGSSAERVCFW